MRMFGPLALLIASPIVAQPSAPVATQPTAITVQLSNFRFTPATLVLNQGQPYRLHFVNVAAGGHDFVAKAFFASSSVAWSDQGKIRDGSVDLDGHEEKDIALVPREAGTFRSHCSHFMHGAFGMKGEIVVQPAARS